MDILKAIILGVIQGLTEFLPVSSSGHLELGKAILGDTSVGEESLLFTVVLHFATALSTVVIFRKDILEIIKGFLKFKWNDDTQFIFKIVISMLPAVIVGLFFEEQLEQLFGGSIMLVGFMLLVTGALLFLADKAKNTTKNVSTTNAVLIGFSQAIAMLPGISRSGATISTSVLLGVDKTKAARFSFLLSIPVILGAGLLKTLDLLQSPNVIDWYALLFGAAFSFVSAYACIYLFLAWIAKIGMLPFVIYRLILGTALLLFVFV